jgi:hypothetical protein
MKKTKHVGDFHAIGCWDGFILVFLPQQRQPGIFHGER